MDFDYSFVIRTVGSAGYKYQQLLNSINKLTIKPREVLVVLPEGYEPPQERLGWERFVFTPKGMIAQRAFCLDEIKTEFAVFSDDDWEFEPELVEKIAKPIIDGRADVTFPVFPDLLPKGLPVRMVMAAIGSAVPIIFPGRRFTKILSSGSYAYNPYINNSSTGEYVAETAPGLCFLTSIKHMKNLRFEDELWLEKAKYSWGEDQIMYYKLHLQGRRIIGVAGIDFVHLDAGSSSPERAMNLAYAQTFFKYIFWHRFIYNLRQTSWQRFLVKTSYKWTSTRGKIFSFIRYSKSIKESSSKGLKDAKEFVASLDYLQLPSIK